MVKNMSKTKNYVIDNHNNENNPELDNDVQQPLSEEQPNSENEEHESDKEINEMLEICEKNQRRQYLLEKAMLCVVVMIAASVVGFLICGKWLNAVNNLLWLFIALMYRRQKRFFLEAGRLLIYFIGKNINLGKQNENYEKMVKVYEEKDALLRELMENYEKRIANYKVIVDKQDKVIERLKSKDK